MHYAQQRSPSSNAIGFGLIILLHLGVGYALLQALATQRMDKVPVPVEVALIAEQPKVIEPPTATVPITVDHPTLDFRPDVELSIKPAVPVQEPIETTSSPDTHDLSKTVAVEPAPGVDTHAGAKVLARPRIVWPSPPFGGRNLEGWVDLQCDVDDMGSTSNCSMLAHEGAMAIVDLALDYVRGSRYSPATRNGVAVAEKGHRFHVVFKLADK